MAREMRNAEVLEVRETDAGEHYADLRIVTYGVVDTYKTTFRPGVFARSVAEGEISSVWSHDSSRPIGVVREFRDSAQHLDGRLYFLDFDSVPDARMAYEAMKKKAIKGVSFAFERHADEADTEHRGATRITDADMHEISPVLVNSVPGTRVLAVRAVNSDESITRSAAADILIKFQQGQLDLADALGELKAGVVAVSPVVEEEKPAEDVVEEEVKPTDEEVAAQEAELAAMEAEDQAMLAQLDKLSKGL